MELSNRTVLVTGGNGGIGLGIAEAFLRSKSKVIVCGRNKEKLSAVGKQQELEGACQLCLDNKNVHLSMEILLLTQPLSEFGVAP